MTNDERRIQALKLIKCGTGMRLTHLGNTLVSHQAPALRRDGLIKEAPERWIAYDLTAAGKAVLAAHCDTPGCFAPRGQCEHTKETQENAQ